MAPVAAAQDSLGEAARRERERRRAAGASARSYSDADLATARGGRPAPSPSPTTKAASPSPAPPEPDRAALEKAWRARFAEARQRLRDADERAWETVVEPVLAPGGIFVPMQVRKKVETEELRQARQALADLEEELRRSGGPPGWGRE